MDSERQAPPVLLLDCGDLRGTLSSYAYVLLCIALLQQRKPAILPVLQDMRPPEVMRCVGCFGAPTPCCSRPSALF